MRMVYTTMMPSLCVQIHIIPWQITSRLGQYPAESPIRGLRMSLTSNPPSIRRLYTANILARKSTPCNHDIKSRTLKITFAWGQDDKDIGIVRQARDDEIEAWSFDDEFGKRVGC